MSSGRTFDYLYVGKKHTIASPQFGLILTKCMSQVEILIVFQPKSRPSWISDKLRICPLDILLTTYMLVRNIQQPLLNLALYSLSECLELTILIVIWLERWPSWIFPKRAIHILKVLPSIYLLARNIQQSLHNLASYLLSVCLEVKILIIFFG